MSNLFQQDIAKKRKNTKKSLRKLFSTTSRSYLDLSNHYPLDLEKARSLLKQAGYPNGFKATFTTTELC